MSEGQEAADKSGGDVDIDEPAWRDESPTNLIARAIATREDQDVVDLPPLRNTVETEAMDALLRSSESISLTFTHLGYEVTATGDGVIYISKDVN